MKIAAVAALVLAAHAGAAGAADPAAGAAKAKEVCATCHGIDGNSGQAEVPRLGGQYADFLAKSLRDYRSGARKNPIMQGFVSALTKQDIDNLAAYYAAQPRVLTTKW